MDTNSMLSFMDIIVVACGAYLLYGYYLLMFRNEIRDGLTISKGADPNKCRDIEGYKRYIGPKLLLFALTAIVSGALGLINTYVVSVPMVLYWIFYALFFTILIWFAVCCRKAEQQYF